MDTTLKSITLKTKNKSYDIFVGNNILSIINEKKKLLGFERFAVIISSAVYKLYGIAIEGVLKEYINYDIIIMKDGEKYKNYKYAEKFFNQLLRKGFSRKSVIIAIGGGVVGDFSGYLAAGFMRGIPVIHIPTTLLAMVDSSIGGKVAVNISAGKNIVGAFHQPEMVISDILFLKTLPDNEFKNGLTETVKHALIGEEVLLDIFLKNDLDTIKKDDIIEEVVYLSAKFKSSVVEQDEKESGLRAILNFGHTIGHAIESLSGFKGISHGEAVAIGLKLEMELSRRIGWLNDNDIALAENILNKYNLIYSKHKLNAEQILEHMKYDKKNINKEIKLVLLKNIGKPVYNQQVDEKIIKDVISSF